MYRPNPIPVPVARAFSRPACTTFPCHVVGSCPVHGAPTQNSRAQEERVVEAVDGPASGGSEAVGHRTHRPGTTTERAAVAGALLPEVSTRDRVTHGGSKAAYLPQKIPALPPSKVVEADAVGEVPTDPEMPDVMEWVRGMERIRLECCITKRTPQLRINPRIS